MLPSRALLVPATFLGILCLNLACGTPDKPSVSLSTSDSTSRTYAVASCSHTGSIPSAAASQGAVTWPVGGGVVWTGGSDGQTITFTCPGGGFNPQGKADFNW